MPKGSCSRLSLGFEKLIFNGRNSMDQISFNTIACRKLRRFCKSTMIEAGSWKERFSTKRNRLKQIKHELGVHTVCFSKACAIYHWRQHSDHTHRCPFLFCRKMIRILRASSSCGALFSISRVFFSRSGSGAHSSTHHASRL